jgi:hypothetical protein
MRARHGAILTVLAFVAGTWNARDAVAAEAWCLEGVVYDYNQEVWGGQKIWEHSPTVPSGWTQDLGFEVNIGHNNSVPGTALEHEWWSNSEHIIVGHTVCNE